MARCSVGFVIGRWRSDFGLDGMDGRATYCTAVLAILCAYVFEEEERPPKAKMMGS